MLVTVFVAGAAGAVCRYLLDGLVQERWAGAFPMGTFTVNILGAFLLGVLTGAMATHPSAPPMIVAGLGVGFIGAFTTFSTLMYESLRLLREGSPRYAAANLLGGAVVGVIVASMGLALGAAV